MSGDRDRQTDTQLRSQLVGQLAEVDKPGRRQPVTALLAPRRELRIRRAPGAAPVPQMLTAEPVAPLRERVARHPAHS